MVRPPGLIAHCQRCFGQPVPEIGNQRHRHAKRKGFTTNRSKSGLALIVQLEKWDFQKDYERLGLKETSVTLFGCQIPQVVLPVEPGRNIAQLVEIAALMQRLRVQGINLAEDFERQIIENLKAKRKAARRKKRPAKKSRAAKSARKPKSARKR